MQSNKSALNHIQYIIHHPHIYTYTSLHCTGTISLLYLWLHPGVPPDVVSCPKAKMSDTTLWIKHLNEVVHTAWRVNESILNTMAIKRRVDRCSAYNSLAGLSCQRKVDYGTSQSETKSMQKWLYTAVHIPILSGKHTTTPMHGIVTCISLELNHYRKYYVNKV